ncbi:MAG: LON peptidase substrate-binding domain-containing protein [Arenicellaceae bacterium]|nr:LON peptidase substrate-binding domain-containing protein [Arenicellaceae bacterium]
MEISLFPLNTVLLPGGSLSLQLFEPRYLEMAAQCLKTDSAFGVVLIKQGHETGIPAATFSTGTTAHIQDWGQLGNGILEVKCSGENIFAIQHTQTQKLNLLRATIKMVEDASSDPLPTSYRAFLELWRRLQYTANLFVPAAPLTAWDELYRFCDVVSIPVEIKQHVLESSDLESTADLLLGIAQKVDISINDQYQQ